MSVRIGIEIGGTKQQLVIGHPDGTIVDRCRFSMNPESGGLVIRKCLEEELPKNDCHS